MVCRLPHDRRPGWPLRWAPDQPVEKGRGWHRAVPSPHIARKQWPLYHLSAESFWFFNFARMSFVTIGSAGPVGHLSPGQYWRSCQTCHCILKWSQIYCPTPSPSNHQYFADQKLVFEWVNSTSCMSLDLPPQVIYLLLDVMYSFPTKEGASVESFPIAFAIPIGLVKLVQGLWLLDHNDHQVRWNSYFLPNGPRHLMVCMLSVQQLWAHTFFLSRVLSSCSFIQRLLSASLSGSMSGSCTRWCVRASTLLHYVISMLWNLQSPLHPKLNSACQCCYKTGRFLIIIFLSLNIV